MIDIKEHCPAPGFSIFYIKVYFLYLFAKGFIWEWERRLKWFALLCNGISSSRNEDLVKWLHIDNISASLTFLPNKESSWQCCFSSETLRHLQCDTYFGRQIFLDRHCWQIFLARFVDFHLYALHMTHSLAGAWDVLLHLVILFKALDHRKSCPKSDTSGLTSSPAIYHARFSTLSEHA